MILVQFPYFNIFSFEVLRYFSTLRTSSCTESSVPIKPLLHSHLCKYSLSTSALGCCALYIVISFLVFQCIPASSIVVQLMIPAPYLIMEIALELVPKIISPRFSFGFSIFMTVLVYFFFIWPFISSYLTPSTSKVSRYLYPPYSIPFIIFPLRILITLLFTTFPLFMIWSASYTLVTQTPFWCPLRKFFLYLLSCLFDLYLL